MNRLGVNGIGIDGAQENVREEIKIDALTENSFYACRINEGSLEAEPQLDRFFRVAAVIQTNTVGISKGRIILGFPHCGEIPAIGGKGGHGYMLFFTKEFLCLHMNNISLINSIRGELNFTGTRVSSGIFQVDTDSAIALDVISIIKTCIIGQKLNDPSNYKNIAASSIQAILMIALKQKKKAVSALSVCSDSSQRLQQCLDYIEKNYMEEITAQKLAKMAMMSETGFRKLFSDTIGVPLKKYVSRLRINKAISLLDGDDLSLKDIAARVGYRDMSTFYRNFHKETKMTPVQYYTRFRTM